MKKFVVKFDKILWYPLQSLVAIGCGCGAVGLLWIIASLIEISCKNLSPNAIYSAWNFFIAIPF